jgi:hypothetical protein
MFSQNDPKELNRIIRGERVRERERERERERGRREREERQREREMMENDSCIMKAEKFSGCHLQPGKPRKPVVYFCLNRNPCKLEIRGSGQVMSAPSSKACEL